VLALVTRPRDESEAVARSLAERGIDSLIEPLLDIAAVPEARIEPEGLQGLLVTSANGARAVAALLPDRHLPVWAVGDSSARTARALGFTQVESADGDVETLADLVTARVDPARGALLHAAGETVAGDLSGRLGARGFTVRRETVYRAVTATRLSDAAQGALAAGHIGLALFFSPRTAGTFVSLLSEAGLGGTVARVTAYGLSANVIAKLAPVSWAALRQAAEPTLAALLAAIDEDGRRS